MTMVRDKSFLQLFFPVSYKDASTSTDHEMMEYASNWTRSIEIKYLSNDKKSEVLTRVYFPLDPMHAVCLEVFICLWY